MESYAPNSSSLLSNDDLYRPHSHNHNHNANNNNTPGASANPTNHTGGGAGAGGGIPVGQSTFPGNRNVPPTNTVRRYPVVQCVAPEHLSEGYTFDVEVHHEILTITVPLGGVRKGQTFHGQTQAHIQDERTVVRIPVGGWKDSLLDFCTYGPFHPSLVMGACCPLVLLGQIYTRLSLNWHGRPIEQEYQQTSTTDDVNHTTTTVLTPQFQYSSRAFKIMVALTIFFRIVLPQFDPYYDPSSNHVEEVVTNDPFMHYSTIIYFFICAILIARTRTYIRRRYEIQATVIEEMVERAPCACCRNLVSGLEDHESVPFGCDVVEDYLLSCFCAPCVVTQMSRHTAPYDTYDGSLCSSNGLPEHAPAMI